jgi:hypothetical protein
MGGAGFTQLLPKSSVLNFKKIIKSKGSLKKIFQSIRNVRKAKPMKLDELTDHILSAAHEVHLGVGPGLHRAEYEKCLFSKALQVSGRGC